MNTQTLDINNHHDDAHAAHMDKVTVTGFWLYLMTDLVSFATLFAVFAVSADAVALGKSAKELFDLSFVAWETAILLISSLTFGFAILAQHKNNKSAGMLWLFITLLLGLSFVFMEVWEFNHLIAEGSGPNASAFLSAFFLLVGTHGVHVTVGCLWLVIMMIQLQTRGFNRDVKRRLSCLSLFWHFLDIVWIGVFSTVYLWGTML